MADKKAVEKYDKKQQMEKEERNQIQKTKKKTKTDIRLPEAPRSRCTDVFECIAEEPERWRVGSDQVTTQS